MNVNVVKTIRTSLIYRLVLEYDEAYSMEDFGEWEGIERAYYWDGPYRKWQLFYGSRGVKCDDVVQMHTDRQGYPIRIHHNGVSDDVLVSFRNIYCGEVYYLRLEKWNPEPGIGWVFKDSVSQLTGYNLYSDEEIVKLSIEVFGEDHIDLKYFAKEAV